MPITNEHLSDIESAFDAVVLYEIFVQYRAGGNRPTARVYAALGRVYGKTADEMKTAFESYGISARLALTLPLRRS